MDTWIEITKRTDFPLVLQELQAFWQEEERKRKEFYELIHENMKAEFINGEIVMHSPVKNKHWKACTRIGARMSVFVDTHRLGTVGIEKVMIRCTRNDYEPDIVFFGNEKAQHFQPDQLLFPPPDLAVEVLSESTKDNDYGVKFHDYAAHGIGEYWIVDTDAQSVEQYFLEGKSYKLHQKLAGKGLLVCKKIPGFEIEISDIFGT